MPLHIPFCCFPLNPLLEVGEGTSYKSTNLTDKDIYQQNKIW